MPRRGRWAGRGARGCSWAQALLMLCVGPRAGTYSNLVKQAKSKQKILDKMEADLRVLVPGLRQAAAAGAALHLRLLRVQRPRGGHALPGAPPRAARSPVCVHFEVCVSVPVKRTKAPLSSLFSMRSAMFGPSRRPRLPCVRGCKRTSMRCGGACSAARTSRSHMCHMPLRARTEVERREPP